MVGDWGLLEDDGGVRVAAVDHLQVQEEATRSLPD